MRWASHGPMGGWVAPVTREDVGEVTTSLQRPVVKKTGRSNSVPQYDEFEIQPAPPERPTNGVPRSAWTRAKRTVSRWHRPYTVMLLLLDFGAAAIASLVAVSLFEQAASGFQDPDNGERGSRPWRTCCCRSAGWSCCGPTAPTTAATSASAPMSSNG